MVVSSTKSVMNAPVLRRLKKSNSSVGTIPTFRVVVFGQSGVGKTAMSVRFVTKRFIGEYDPTLENIYQHYCGIGGSTVLFEIMDTAGQEENDMMMEEKIRWADAFLLVYAINDQTSFDEITRLKFTIAHTTSRLGNQHKAQHDPVIIIVGNKTDLEPDRMVDTEEGETLARNMNCGFREISVRDGVNEVFEVFEEIHEAYKYRVAVFQAFNETNGSLSRRKNKSFKYVDRIPRMQGKRGSVSPFQDLNNRYHHGSDVASGVMTSAIDEDSDRTEHRFGSLAAAHNHAYTRSTISLPAELNGSNSPTESVNVRRPLRRRNAVIGLGSSSSLLSNDQSSDEDKQRRPMRQQLYGTSCIPESFDGVGKSPNYDSNNNTNSKKTSRRCFSQDNFGLTSRHPLENMSKTAVSFDSTSGMGRRVS